MKLIIFRLVASLAGNQLGIQATDKRGTGPRDGFGNNSKLICCDLSLWHGHKKDPTGMCYYTYRFLTKMVTV